MKTSEKLFFVIVIIGVIFLFYICGLSAYSTGTAKTFCKEKGMSYYEIVHGRTFDSKDDVICYSLDLEREMKFYYFYR